MKKFIYTIVAIFIAFAAQAQLVQPIKWSGKVVGDSIRLTAIIEKGWHLNIIELGDGEYDQEYEGTFTETVAKADQVTVRFNACDDKMCTAPETWTYKLPVTKTIKEEKVKKEVIANTPTKETPEKAKTSDVEVSPSLETENKVSDQTKEEKVEPNTPSPKEENKKTTSKETTPKSIWWVFVMGLLGGIMAIFTPCVWPIIPMTVSFFIKRGGAQKGTTNSQVIRDAIFYGLSIIIVYVALGLLVTLIFGASALNALSTNAVVNIIFFLVLVVFAASFFGAFEITLPSSWSTALNSKSGKTSGFISILLMAFTLVIVSFSCTGPIIGTLLVEAAGKSIMAPAMGMLGFAIALALPFTLFAMFPSVLKKLPKSGGWMNTFKVTLAFLELALALKFLSVADLAYGWHILDREVFIALWIIIFTLLGLYLLGLIAFPHDDDDHRKTSVPRLFLAIISLAFAM